MYFSGKSRKEAQVVRMKRITFKNGHGIVMFQSLSSYLLPFPFSQVISDFSDVKRKECLDLGHSCRVRW